METKLSPLSIFSKLLPSLSEYLHGVFQYPVFGVGISQLSGTTHI